MAPTAWVRHGLFPSFSDLQTDRNLCRDLSPTHYPGPTCSCEAPTDIRASLRACSAAQPLSKRGLLLLLDGSGSSSYLLSLTDSLGRLWWDQPNYDYGSGRPHAVTGATTSAGAFTMGYDSNGNLASRSRTGESWSFRYAGFDKPRWMAKNTTSPAKTAGSEFLYNANRSRIMQLEFDHASGTVPNQVPDHYVRKRIYALGQTLEVNYSNSAGQGITPNWNLDDVRIYFPGPDGVIGAREFHPPQSPQEKTLVYHYDHLGSIDCITNFGSTAVAWASDSSGKPGEFSEDAWGQRRNPFTWSGAPVTTSNDANKSDDGGADSLTPRGFTGHEMLDDLGLVHMNGRIYDPLLGRFLSADVQVQFPGSLQSYNRYSYVRNNPLTVTDPSGFGESFQEWMDKHKDDPNVKAVKDHMDANGEKQLTVDPAKGTATLSTVSANQASPTGRSTLSGRLDQASPTPKMSPTDISTTRSSTSTSTSAASPADVSTTRSSTSKESSINARQTQPSASTLPLSVSSPNEDSLNPALAKVAQTGIYVGAGVLEKTATIGEMANIMAGTTIGIVGAGLDLIPPKAGAFLSDFGKYASQLKTGVDSIDEKLAFTTNGMRLLGNASRYGAQLRDYGFAEANNASVRFDNYFAGRWSDQLSPFNE